MTMPIAVTQHDVRRRGRGEPPIRSEVLALLEDLHAEGITPPADAVAAIELLQEVEGRYSRPNLPAWVAAADLATLDADQITDQLRTAFVDFAMHSSGSNFITELLDGLAARAVAALTADCDRILDDLRGSWDPAAAVVRAAAAAGIQPNSSPADVIKMGDAACEAWRTLGGPVAVLDRLHRLRNRLLFVSGREISDHDLGSVNWLDRASAGPPQLTGGKPTTQPRQLAAAETTNDQDEAMIAS